MAKNFNTSIDMDIQFDFFFLNSRIVLQLYLFIDRLRGNSIGFSVLGIFIIEKNTILAVCTARIVVCILTWQKVCFTGLRKWVFDSVTRPNVTWRRDLRRRSGTPSMRTGKHHQLRKCHVENLIRENGLLQTSLFNWYLQIRLAFCFCCAFVSGSRTVTYLLRPGCSVRNSVRQFDDDLRRTRKRFCCCNCAVVLSRYGDTQHLAYALQKLCNSYYATQRMNVTRYLSNTYSLK